MCHTVQQSGALSSVPYADNEGMFRFVSVLWGGRRWNSRAMELIELAASRHTALPTQTTHLKPRDEKPLLTSTGQVRSPLTAPTPIYSMPLGGDCYLCLLPHPVSPAIPSRARMLFGVFNSLCFISASLMTCFRAKEG